MPKSLQVVVVRSSQGFSILLPLPSYRHPGLPSNRLARNFSASVIITLLSQVLAFRVSGPSITSHQAYITS